ncbi:chemokine XC receptor 1-like isoform X2 [Astyanax mexicanus]|uniref:X-C motif chemokine receptor 1 n=2 Tax=Astyanax mexicanus TaxID=7994 RepID=A0A3B1JF22_ASTMX|nr:chemokine XC receptor 1-like isoform X2 [Astyanax mexicanus]
MEFNNSSTSLNDSDYDYGNGSGAVLIKLCEPKTYGELTGICYITICCISLIGNSLLLYGLARFEDLKRVTMLFILCLAIFDLLFTLTLPFWAVEHLHQWIFGDVACKILIGAYFVGLYGSLILLTAMTIDRFFAIVIRSPWLTRRRRLYCAKGACVGAWIISVGACLKDVLSSKGDENACTADFSQEDIFEYYTQLFLLFFFPLAIIIFCYGKILHTLMSITSKKKYRTVLVVLCIVVAFVICWGPYHIFMIIMAAYKPKECWKKDQLDKAFTACRILAYFHCCVNPMLYMLRGRSKKILSSLVFCSPELRQGLHQERHTEPSHSNIVQQNSVVERVELKSV